MGEEEVTERTRRYLGDAVYCEWDGTYFKLTTSDGSETPTNTIYLEPEIYLELVAFVDDTVIE